MSSRRSQSLTFGGLAHAEVKKGDHFVELDAKTAKGKKFRLKDMAGKWVLYTFGASWCQPCHKELPAWDRIAPKFAGKVLFVAVNINDKVEDGQEFLDSLKLKHLFPVFMPDENERGAQGVRPRPHAVDVRDRSEGRRPLRALRLRTGRRGQARRRPSST